MSQRTSEFLARSSTIWEAPVQDGPIRWYLCATSCILFAAAASKLLLALTDLSYFWTFLTYQNLGFDLGLVALSFFEIMLGLIFFSSDRQFRSVALCTLFFAISTIFQFHWVVLGEKECSCFGRLSFSPILVGMLDASVAIAGIGFIVYSRFANRMCDFNGLWGNVRTGLCVFVLTVAIMLVKQQFCPQGFYGMTPFVISLKPSEVDVDGDQIGVTYLLRNNSANNMRVLGVQQNCSLKANGGYPVSVEPAQVARIRLAVVGVSAKAIRIPLCPFYMEESDVNVRSSQCWRTFAY